MFTHNFPEALSVFTRRLEEQDGNVFDVGLSNIVKPIKKGVLRF